MASKPKLIHSYTQAVLNYGITAGSMRDAEDPNGYYKILAIYAHNAAQAAQVRAESAEDAPIREAWKVETAYWSDLEAKHQEEKV